MNTETAKPERKPLALEFTKNGFHHVQIRREGNIAIYRRARTDRPDKPHFETIRITGHDGYQIPGTEKRAEPAETYPGSERFGSDGFTYGTLDEARARFEKMLNDEKRKA